MYKLIYNEFKGALIKKNPNGKSELLSVKQPSRPVYSPNQEYATYIAPLEWEVPGALYLFNLKEGKNTKLISTDEDSNTPKFVVWLNNEVLVVIIGYGKGTVAIGGNVFTYNINNGNFKQVTDYSNRIQITSIKIVAENLLLQGIRYTDDILNDFEDFVDEIKIHN